MTTSTPNPTSGADTVPQPSRQDLEHRYYQYLRGQSYITEAALMDVLRCYLPYFQGFQRVLDIGCGHGEFLQMLENKGHEAMGVDIDPAMVATCQANGLNAVEADAITWLATQEAEFDAIFSSNVIEHLDAESVQTLVRHAFHALRPGGILLLGTPNPESLIVQLHEFWRDPTHVRLYSRQLLEFFFTDAGFAAIGNGDNAAAIWDGVDAMTDPGHYPPPPLVPFTESTPAPPYGQSENRLHPLPAAPPANAPLRQRLVFRVLHFVYQKFLEPYIALLRHDLARLNEQLTQTRNYTLELHQYSQRLHAAHLQLTNALQATLDQQEGRFAQVGNGLRFLYPAREFFVYGYKPPVPASALDATTDNRATNDIASNDIATNDIATTESSEISPLPSSTAMTDGQV